MRRNFFAPAAFAALALSLAPQAAQAEKIMESKDALKQLLSGAPKLAKVKVAATPDDAKLLKDKWNVSDAEATFYLGKGEDGATQKAAVILSEKGKEGPISVAIGLDAAGKITEVLVLDFSEERGKPAKEASFLKQFKGKDASAKMKLGDDVDGVAGATWTSTSMATLARRAVSLYKVLVLDKAGK